MMLIIRYLIIALTLLVAMDETAVGTACIKTETNRSYLPESDPQSSPRRKYSEHTPPLTSSFSSIRTSHVHLNDCPMRDTCSRLKPISLAPKFGFCALNLVEQARTKWTCPASHKRIKACVRFFVHGFESPLHRLMIVYFLYRFFFCIILFSSFFLYTRYYLQNSCRWCTSIPVFKDGKH